MKRMTKIVSRRKIGFGLKPLHKKREPHPVFYLSQRGSFWIATFSMVAFVMGNMVGQHGWYLFWASVLGKEEIVYTGTVPPVDRVPDYSKWLEYGGDPYSNTFRQVPENALRSLPIYTKNSAETSVIYSVAHMGDYRGGPERSGSHLGVDIRTPIGTPILAVMNGIIHEVGSDDGFGNYVMIRHANAPDPNNPNERTTLYSLYAHLDSAFVTTGTMVSKGEQIGTSGMTGFASGPHLHFQITLNDTTRWPFTAEQQQAAGMTFTEAVNAGLNMEKGFQDTVSPMLYVQANYVPIDAPTTLVQDPIDRLLSSVEKRRLARMETRGYSQTVVLHSAASSVSTSSSSSSSNVEIRMSPALRAKYAQEERMQERQSRQLFVGRQVEQKRSTPIVQSEKVVTREVHTGLSSSPVQNVRITHDRSYSGRGWESITVQLLDKDGNHIKNPQINDDLYMRTSYGEAEFRPSTLTSLDFINGEATVHMLPLGRRTIVIQAWPFPQQSEPMPYVKG